MQFYRCEIPFYCWHQGGVGALYDSLISATSDSTLKKINGFPPYTNIKRKYKNNESYNCHLHSIFKNIQQFCNNKRNFLSI